ncbi:hypothetical protein BGZ75_004939 [Mortierella antarctica]|nr:hypothetical protein BGZ75_004939 [Mortierella antarctica]
MATTWHGFDDTMTKSRRPKGTYILQRLAGFNMGQLKHVFEDLCYHHRAMSSHCLELKDSMPKLFEHAWYAGQTLSFVLLQESPGKFYLVCVG